MRSSVVYAKLVRHILLCSMEDQQGLIDDELNAILDIEDAVWDIYA
jgi:hypothetical protein